MRFYGEDVEVVTGADAPPVRVLIDGLPPAELPELYEHGTASGTHRFASWPAVLEIKSEAPLVPEDWRLTITGTGPGWLDFDFAVQGSVTGPDGTGSNRADFRSPSGRVVIARDAYAFPLAVMWGGAPIPEGFAVNWQSRFRGTNEFTPRAPAQPGAQPTFRLARGLAPGWHHLELLTTNPVADGLRLVRAYSLGHQAEAVPAGSAVKPRLELRAAPGVPGWELAWPAGFPECWPATRADFAAESAWQPVAGEARLAQGWLLLPLPPGAAAAFFQLQTAPSVPPASAP